MDKRAKGKNLFVLVTLAFFLLTAPYFFASETVTKGNVIGFLYAKDGTTPLEGGIVKFKNLTSGTIFESSKSDSNGIFRVQGIESGIYTYGVLTPDGDFNADNLVGFRIQENETAKMSIAVNPYSKEEASAVSQIYKDQQVAGESLVGTVADFNPSTQIAQVQIVKGLLRVKDKIHAKGKTTDFYQQVSILMAGSSSARQVLPGQMASVKLERKAFQGDLIYVVVNKNLFPLFLAPLGVASILAGTSAVNYGIVKINDELIPVSAHKNK
jgi:hypothetical protein